MQRRNECGDILTQFHAGQPESFVLRSNFFRAPIAFFGSPLAYPRKMGRAQPESDRILFSDQSSASRAGKPVAVFAGGELGTGKGARREDLNAVFPHAKVAKNGHKSGSLVNKALDLSRFCDLIERNF